MEDDGLVWTQVRDHREQYECDLGLPVAAVTGVLIFAEGWHFDVITPMMRGNLNGTFQEVVGPAMVILRVPDYPAEDAVTVAIHPKDARKMASLLIQSAVDAERITRDMIGPVRAARLREVEQREQGRIREEGKAQIRCAEPGCPRQRRFFDDDGNGYCARHAEERGIRPKGKV